MAKRRTGINSLAYLGVNAVTPGNVVEHDRAPTSNDYISFTVGDIWINHGPEKLSPPVVLTAEDVYILVSKNRNLNNANWVRISSTSPISTVTTVATTPFVVTTSMSFLSVDSSAAPITIQLPNSPPVGANWTIKDATGSANTNNITVTTVGGVKTIDGVTSYVMNTQFAAINVIYTDPNYEIF